MAISSHSSSHHAVFILLYALQLVWLFCQRSQPPKLLLCLECANAIAAVLFRVLRFAMCTASPELAVSTRVEAIILLVYFVISAQLLSCIAAHFLRRSHSAWRRAKLLLIIALALVSASTLVWWLYDPQDSGRHLCFDHTVLLGMSSLVFIVYESKSKALQYGDVM